jgi:hypothetical protein
MYLHVTHWILINDTRVGSTERNDDLRRYASDPRKEKWKEMSVLCWSGPTKGSVLYRECRMMTVRQHS